jgi:hypothetical protein
MSSPPMLLARRKGTEICGATSPTKATLASDTEADTVGERFACAEPGI